MDNAAAYQTQIIARQHMADEAFAAREYTRRHTAREIGDETPGTRHFHIHWPHPAWAGFQH